MKRRDLIIAVGVFGGVFSIPPLLRRIRSSFEFTPLGGFDGFRRLEQGTISSVPSFLLGLETPSAEQIQLREKIYQDPCGYLFGAPALHDDRLPIAIFSDYYCPYCAILSRHLIRLEKERGDIRLILHELPLLGPHSTRTAKVALAAKQQGKQLAAHARLMDGILPPGPVALRVFAEELGLDANQLAQDAEGSQVAADIQITATLARALGIVGTPGTMLGRTLVVGAISPRDIERLVKLERSEPFAGCF